MLTAIYKDGLIAAEGADKAHVYYCPDCGSKVITKVGSDYFIDHFAHYPGYDCPYKKTESESKEHKEEKIFWYKYAKSLPGVTDAMLERSFGGGAVRPDVSFMLNGVWCAIEIQKSPITNRKILERTTKLSIQGLYTIWVPIGKSKALKAACRSVSSEMSVSRYDKVVIFRWGGEYWQSCEMNKLYPLTMNNGLKILTSKKALDRRSHQEKREREAREARLEKARLAMEAQIAEAKVAAEQNRIMEENKKKASRRWDDAIIALDKYPKELKHPNDDKVRVSGSMYGIIGPQGWCHFPLDEPRFKDYPGCLEVTNDDHPKYEGYYNDHECRYIIAERDPWLSKSDLLAITEGDLDLGYKLSEWIEDAESFCIGDVCYAIIYTESVLCVTSSFAFYFLKKWASIFRLIKKDAYPKSMRSSFDDERFISNKIHRLLDLLKNKDSPLMGAITVLDKYRQLSMILSEEEMNTAAGASLFPDCFRNKASECMVCDSTSCKSCKGSGCLKCGFSGRMGCNNKTRRYTLEICQECKGYGFLLDLKKCSSCYGRGFRAFYTMTKQRWTSWVTERKWDKLSDTRRIVLTPS